MVVLWLLPGQLAARCCPGVILLLNGTGSAGKSSFGRALEDSLGHSVFLSEELRVLGVYQQLLVRTHLQPPAPIVNIRQMIEYVRALPPPDEAVFRGAVRENSDRLMKHETHRLIGEPLPRAATSSWMSPCGVRSSWTNGARKRMASRSFMWWSTARGMFCLSE